MSSSEFSFVHLSALIESDYDAAILIVNNEIDSARTKLNDYSSLPALIAKIKDSSEIINNLLRLKPEDTLKFNDALNEILNLANQKVEDEKKAREVILDNNFNMLSAEMDSLLNFPAKLDFKKTKSSLVNFQNKVRNSELKKSAYDELYKKVQDSFVHLNKLQEAEHEQYEMECWENYLNIKKDVEKVCNDCQEGKNFKQCRQELIDLQTQIKNLKLKREQKDELYSAIRETFNNVNKRQDDEREIFEKQSAENYDIIKPVVEEACLYAKNTENYKEAREALINVQNRLKNIKLKKADKDKFFEDIRNIFNELIEKQNSSREEYDKECSDNYVELSEKVKRAHQNASDNPEFKSIRDELIEAQFKVKEAKLKKEQRNELFKKIREGFEILDSRRNLYMKDRESYRVGRLNKALGDLKMKNQRLEETLSYDRESLEDIRTKLEYSADQSQSEIQEELCLKLKTLENRIEEKMQKIAETQTRIEDIMSELTNLAE